MSSLIRHSKLRLAIGLALLLLGSGPAWAQPFQTFYWKSGVSGLTSDPTKWNPIGVPGVSDWLGLTASGVYTVTFASNNLQSGKIFGAGGVLTLQFPFSHTTGPLIVTHNSAAHFVRHNRGILNIDYLHLGDSNGYSTLVLEADGNYNGWINSKGMGNPTPTGIGDRIGNAGTSELHIYGGSRFLCERTESTNGKMSMAVLPGSQALVVVHGSGGLPSRASQLGLNGGALLNVGVEGAATMRVENRGIFFASGDVRVATHGGSSGVIDIGTASSVNGSYMTLESRLLLGGNGAVSNVAGRGELNVRDKAVVAIGGQCEVGDPDNDAGSLLRVTKGGSATFDGGLKFWPTTGTALDLQGGLLHVQGGAFEWPASKHLQVSGVGDTPELRIDNGVANVGPSTLASQAQLFVGRTGSGIMNVDGAGTSFHMGPGASIVADQAGISGTLNVTNGAHLSSQGQMVVGNRGTGAWHVTGGSLGEVGNLSLGTTAGSSGYVNVFGQGSELIAEDKLWIGGGFSGAGGSGTLNVSFGARLEVEHVNGGVNPALTTVFPNGSVQIQYSEMTTPGDISCGGQFTLWDGELSAQSLTLTSSGYLRGYGTVNARINNAGRIDPGFDINQMYTVPINGPYTQYSQGRYEVDLDASGVPQCDRLLIDGTATLGGTLSLRPETGFVATPGDVFRILSCTSRTGTFSNVLWQGAALNGQVEIIYGPDYVDVMVPGATPVDELPVTSVRFASSGGPSHPAFALELPESARVRIVAYDLRGREVGVLFDGRMDGARRSFDLLSSNRELASGVYFARAEVELRGRREVHSAKVVLVQ